MNENTLIKLAKSVTTLSSIPARLYYYDQEIASYSAVTFNPDPISPHIETILNQPHQVNMYATENLMFYGSVKHGDYTIVIGPVGRITTSDALLTEMLFQINEPRNRASELKDYISAIPSSIEVTSFAQMLCDINSVVNGVDVSIYDIDVFNFQSEGDTKEVFKTLQKSLSNIRDADIFGDDPHWNTYTITGAHEFEKNLLYAISHGQVDLLSDPKYFEQTVSVGKLANNNMRQMKNQEICLAVLASRAAIDGGLNVEQSYTLCNIYIQKIEECDDFSELSNISRQIIIDYASRVHTLLVGEDHSPIIARAIQFIARNINQRIYIEDIAEQLNVNRSYLSIRFKKETGMTLTDYIIQQKIFEAQRLIQNTDRSLLQISNYLDFSSQSYFQTQFKKYTGMTPAQYKKNYRK